MSHQNMPATLTCPCGAVEVVEAVWYAEENHWRIPLEILATPEHVGHVVRAELGTPVSNVGTVDTIR